MHVSAMSSSTSKNKSRWNATVTITIVDQSGPLVDATVSGDWSAGANGGAVCVTNASGQCSVSKSNIKSNVPSVTFSVSDVQHAANLYADGDNVFTSLVVTGP